MTKFVLPLLIAVTGLLYIYVIPSEPHLVKLLFKLIPMWLIIAYAALRLPDRKRAHHWLLLFGLVFCMFGDGLLQWFIVGLSAFLIGHLFYMNSFFMQWRYSVWRLLTIVPLALYGAFVGGRVVDAVLAKDDRVLAYAVAAYVAVILLMAWSAIMSGNVWAAVGSLLFTASDSVLAWNRFVEDVAYSGPIIMITYYAAQFCIAHSVSSGSSRSALPSFGTTAG